MEQKKEIEKEFFDNFGREGQEYQRFAEDSYQKIFALFRRMINPQPGEKILDMGCGTGAFTHRLKQAFPQNELSGIDISEACIGYAVKSYETISFRSGDVEKTDFPDQSFDIIAYFGVLHHFPELSRVVAEARRLLKPGGRIFSFDPNHKNPVFWLFRAHESPLYCSKGVTEQERLLTTREFHQLFGANGFTTKTKVISGIKFASVEPRLMKILLPVYNVCDQILGVSPLAPILGAWVVGFARKK